MKKIIIVTGGAGFIASNLINYLLKNTNFKIISIDNYSSGSTKNHFNSKNVRYLKADTCNIDKILFKIKKNIHTIFHFAAKADLIDANKKPFDAIENNVEGTVKIFKAALKNKVKKIIFASSIYARSEQGGIYSTTKLASEMILERLCKKFKIKFVILRFGTVYGERSNKFNTVNNFIIDAKRKKKIYRGTKGDEIRSYIHVKDVAKIVYKSLQKKYENTHINVLGSKKTTVKRLLKIIKEKVPKLKIVYSKKNNRLYNYKINPFTYKIRVGKIVKLERYIKLQDGIHKLINL